MPRQRENEPVEWALEKDAKSYEKNIKHSQRLTKPDLKDSFFKIVPSLSN